MSDRHALPLDDSGDISRAAANCRTLVSDLLGLVNDARLVREGWTLHYAVDFTEIFSYVKGADLWRFMRIFDDEREDTTRAANDFILEQLLLGQQSAILLSPYVIELKSFSQRLTGEAARTAMAETVQAHRELDTLVRSEDFRARRQQLDTISGREIDADTRATVEASLLSYLEQNAATLLRLALPKESPLQRLHRILAGGQLKTLAYLGFNESQIRVDSSRIGQLARELSTKRPAASYGASYFDVLALEILEAANTRLLPKHERLLFVTRVKALHDLAEERRTAGVAWDFLRHPRLYRAQFDLRPDGAHRRDVEDLEAVLEAMRTFVKGFDEFGTSQETVLGTTLQELRRHWNAQADLRALIQSQRRLDKPCDEDRKPVFDFVAKLVTVDTAIVKRIEDLGRLIQQTTEFLSFAVQVPQGLPLEGLGILRPLMGARAGGVGTKALAALPYRLMLDVERLPAGLRGLARGEVDNWPTVLGSFRQSLEVPDGYPTLLVFAYVLGQWRRWDAAVYFAERALIAGEHERDAAVDARLLLAHYLRKRRQATESDWNRASEILDKAGHVAPRDARVGVEKIALLLRWHARLRVAASGFREAPVSLTATVALVGEVDEACGSDEALRAQLYDHLCYFYVSTPHEIEGPIRKAAKEALGKLLGAQKKVTTRERDWPPNVRDTVAWARWRLEGGGLTAVQIEGMIRSLVDIGESLPEDDDDAAIAKQHRIVFDEALQALRKSVVP